MSIVEQYTRIQTNIANAYSSCEAKGAILPKIQNSDNLASVIDSIENGGSGGSGATIEVLNKTGAVINPGDKVWLSENTQEAGKGNTVGSSFHNRDYPHKTGVLSRSGNFMVFSNTSYSISADTVTKIGSFTCDVGNIKYGPNQSIFSTYNSQTSYRIDEGNQYTLSAGIYIGEGFSSDGNKIYRFNVEDGTILEERDPFYVSNKSFQIMLNDTIIYDLKRWEKGVYNDSSWDRTSLSVTNGEIIYPLNATSDGKYIIGSSKENSFINANYLYTYLRIIEIIDDTHVKVLTQAEMPADLQTYYSAPCYIAFNPYTGILTVCEKDSQNYAVVRYENGEWLKIPMTFGLSGNNYFYGGMTISDDLSRISYVDASKGSTYIYQRIKNLTSTEGYSAIPYKPYTVNENTITATALAESQPNELAQVQIGSVTNEDLTVTENGTYTPSATYTGFGSVTVNIGGSGSGGVTVTAINKTGKAITTGDKVWINENAQTADTSFNISSGSYVDLGFITRTGNNFYNRNSTGFYSVTSSGLTEVQSFGINPYARLLKYMANGTTFLATDNTKSDSFRVDENAQVMLPDLYYPICDDLFIVNTRNWYLYKLNLDTFEEVKGWYFENNALTSENIFIIGNKLYTNYKMYELPEGGGTIPSGTTGTAVSGLSSQRYMGVTSDGKYLLTCYSNSLTTGGDLAIHEVVNDTTFRFVQASELPPEFEPFYNGTSEPVCIFNPYTGVLTCVIPQTQQYLVAKYENGSWNVLPITINHEGNDLQNLTVADDLSRVCYLSGSNSSYKYTIANLETTSGYAAVPYKGYNINEDTITGYAGNDALPDEEITVGIASVPGSTPSVTGGSDTFEAQLILDNVVNSGILKTEEEAVNETVAVLKDILGE